MVSPVDRLAEPREAVRLVPEFCEACGDVVTGKCRPDGLPDGYRYNVFRRYQGICQHCRADASKRTAPWRR